MICSGFDGFHSAVFHDISRDDRRRGMRGGVDDSAAGEVADDGISQCSSWLLLKITSFRAAILQQVSIFVRCGMAGMELSLSLELSHRNESSRAFVGVGSKSLLLCLEMHALSEITSSEPMGVDSLRLSKYIDSGVVMAEDE